jgi:hypothetical protein
MKRTLTILGVCALVALLTLLAFSGGKGQGRRAPTAQYLVVTQAGTLTLVPNPTGYATMTVVAHLPKPSTNAPAASPVR